MSFALYPSLKGRVVFISGGATGIGAALVTHFARQGALVAFCDIEMAAAAVLADGVAAAGHPRPLALECDLRDLAALRRTIDAAAAQMGAIRILVNNAARDDRHTLDEVTPEYWDNCIAVNLRHQFFAIQAVAPGMREAGGGSIINLSSVTWLRGRPGLSAYVAAKAAVYGMTRSLARELGPDNIRVNAITPGWILTERQRKLWLTPAEYDSLMAAQALKRELGPDDIARLALFLAAEDSAGCTAQQYVLDAGLA